MSTDELNPEDALFALLDQAPTPTADDEAAEDESLSPAEKFLRYHRNNPNVYRAICFYAREVVRLTGSRKVGINLLVGKVRYEAKIRVKSADWRVNNIYAPFYARLIEAREPDLVGVFEQRRSIADDDSWMGQA